MKAASYSGEDAESPLRAAGDVSAAGARPRVLVVDDDVHLLAALRRGLSLNRFEVELASDAGSALARVEDGWPEVIVLDIMMPGLDGLSLCRLIRERSSVPVLMLTALDSVHDRVTGLSAGADDYLVKPFALEELVARIQALLRRARAREPATAERLAYADLVLDTGTWSASRGGERLPLTLKEFRLLEYLLRHQGRVFTRDGILAAVWGDDSPVESNVVDAHMANLRQKLEAGGRSRLVQTVRGVGYVLKEE